MTSFVDRHIGPRPSDIAAMVERVGFDSLEALMAAAVPAGIRTQQATEVSAVGQSEHEVLGRLRALSERNNPGVAMIGVGYHPTLTPPVIRRTT